MRAAGARRAPPAARIHGRAGAGAARHRQAARSRGPVRLAAPLLLVMTLLLSWAPSGLPGRLLSDGGVDAGAGGLAADMYHPVAGVRRDPRLPPMKVILVATNGCNGSSTFGQKLREVNRLSRAPGAAGAGCWWDGRAKGSQDHPRLEDGPKATIAQLQKDKRYRVMPNEWFKGSANRMHLLQRGVPAALYDESVASGGIAALAEMTLGGLSDSGCDVGWGKINFRELSRNEDTLLPVLRRWNATLIVYDRSNVLDWAICMVSDWCAAAGARARARAWRARDRSIARSR